MTKEGKENMIDYYKKLNRYGEILFAKDFTFASGYVCVKIIKFIQCMHVVEMLNGEVTNITILF